MPPIELSIRTERTVMRSVEQDGRLWNRPKYLLLFQFRNLTSVKLLVAQNATLILVPFASMSRLCMALTSTLRESTRELAIAEVEKTATARMEWEAQRQTKTTTASKLLV